VYWVPNGHLGSAWLGRHVHQHITTCFADACHGHETDHVYRLPPLRKRRPSLITTARPTRSCRSRKTHFLMSMIQQTRTGRWWVLKMTMALRRPTTSSSSRAKLAQPRQLQSRRRCRVAHQCQQPPTRLTTLSRLPQTAPRNRALLPHWLASSRRSRRKPRRGRPSRPRPTSVHPNDDACNSHPKNPTTKRHHLIFPSDASRNQPLLRPLNMRVRGPRHLRSGRPLLEVSRLTNMTHQAGRSSHPLRGRLRDTASTTFTNTSRSLARTRRCP
jgi:hypothetical protein